MTEERDWSDTVLDIVTSNRTVALLLGFCAFLFGVVALIEGAR